MVTKFLTSIGGPILVATFTIGLFLFCGWSVGYIFGIGFTKGIMAWVLASLLAYASSGREGVVNNAS